MENIKENKKSKNMTDKSFFGSIFASVISILICLTCLVATTWAWCSDDLSSSNNTFEVAEPMLAVIVYDEDTNEEIAYTRDSLGCKIYSLEEGKSYNVVLYNKGNSNAYYVLTVQETDYISSVLPPAENVAKLSVIIQPSQNMQVKFDERWGVHHDSADIKDGEEVTLPSSQ